MASRGDAGVARGSARRRLDDQARVEIRPEPSPAERAALLIALERMLGVARRDEVPRSSAWALAGRREALLGGSEGSRIGWGRDGDRLAGQ
ncbi:MAG: hypothetical protein K0S78_4878 [Thermomicrobiales bacterium]|jgi:hypothetical protein|nr:hypothetical protein [Thermomicrobiales bacterium]